jgi:hypothetical protein
MLTLTASALVFSGQLSKAKWMSWTLHSSQGHFYHMGVLSSPLDARRLKAQKELMERGESTEAGNVKVDQAGNIYDGTHRTRAAIDAGKPVKVDVYESPGAKPGPRSVQDLPVIGPE